MLRRAFTWAVGLGVVALYLLVNDRPSLTVRIAVSAVLIASFAGSLDVADHRRSLHEKSWSWLVPRLLAPYVGFAALATSTVAESSSLGIALLLGPAIALLMPGPLVAATFIRVHRDRSRRLG